MSQVIVTVGAKPNPEVLHYQLRIRTSDHEVLPLAPVKNTAIIQLDAAHEYALIAFVIGKPGAVLSLDVQAEGHLLINNFNVGVPLGASGGAGGVTFRLP